MCVCTDVGGAYTKQDVGVSVHVLCELCRWALSEGKSLCN